MKTQFAQQHSSLSDFGDLRKHFKTFGIPLDASQFCVCGIVCWEIDDSVCRTLANAKAVVSRKQENMLRAGIISEATSNERDQTLWSEPRSLREPQVLNMCMHTHRDTYVYIYNTCNGSYEDLLLSPLIQSPMKSNEVQEHLLQIFHEAGSGQLMKSLKVLEVLFRGRNCPVPSMLSAVGAAMDCFCGRWSIRGFISIS